MAFIARELMITLGPVGNRLMQACPEGANTTWCTAGEGKSHVCWKTTDCTDKSKAAVAACRGDSQFGGWALRLSPSELSQLRTALIETLASREPKMLGTSAARALRSAGGQISLQIGIGPK